MAPANPQLAHDLTRRALREHEADPEPAAGPRVLGARGERRRWRGGRARNPTPSPHPGTANAPGPGTPPGPRGPRGGGGGGGRQNPPGGGGPRGGGAPPQLAGSRPRSG